MNEPHFLMCVIIQLSQTSDYYRCVQNHTHYLLYKSHTLAHTQLDEYFISVHCWAIAHVAVRDSLSNKKCANRDTHTHTQVAAAKKKHFWLHLLEYKFQLCLNSNDIHYTLCTWCFALNVYEQSRYLTSLSSQNSIREYNDPFYNPELYKSVFSMIQ